MCKFYLYNGIGLPDLSAVVSPLTGWNISDKELLEIGERVFTLQRMINVREGVRRADDQIPAGACKLPEFGQYSKVAECAIKDYEQMLDEYYEARGWDRKTGIPTKEKLQQLGLGDLVEL